MRRADLDDARRLVRSMQDELAGSVARCRLLTREPTPDDVETWMETYEDVPLDFETTLAAAVARHGLTACSGERHVERFVGQAG